MPLLDIAIAQSSFQNYLGCSGVQSLIISKIPAYCLLRHEDRWASFHKSLQKTGNLKLKLDQLNKKSHLKSLVKAVATLEPKCSIESKDDEKQKKILSFTSELHDDKEELDEKERLRRIRISKANKGNTPWNKGRKHSPETLQRIKERTRLAMQNPKVKMKLANTGHAQSAETREKIGVGVRLGWEKRRMKLLLQETCLFDWQNLIAEAARKGSLDEEELQWDSYKIMNERLQLEWLASIEHRKKTPRPKGSKRAPKSLEQRRKIAEAIAAKWADPEYRSRVTSGLAKYHKTPEGVERKTRRIPSDGSQKPRTPKKKVSSGISSVSAETKVKTLKPKLKKRTAPKYKDPLANSKLEMLKNIRAQRGTSEVKNNEALERAKLLIAEAEKAATALEIAATRSPVARASLIEARKLIDEATQYIKSIENQETISEDDLTISEDDLTLGPQINFEKDETPLSDSDAAAADDDGNGYPRHHGGVNGTHTGFVQKNGQNLDIGIVKLPEMEQMDMNLHLSRRLGGYEFSNLDVGGFIGKSELRKIIGQHVHELNGATKLNGLYSHHQVTKLQNNEQVPSVPAKTVTKKWVCGRLVEVPEDE